MSKLVFNNIQQQGIAVLFSLLLVAQVLFPVQLHTQVAHTASGKTVVICTLQGYQNVTVDTEGNFVSEAEASQTQSSPAIKFSQLLSAATPLTSFYISAKEEFVSSQVYNLQLELPDQSGIRQISIRAPPVFPSLMIS